MNDEGINDLILVDDFSKAEKGKNLEGKKFLQQIHRDQFFEWLEQNHASVKFIFHLGARTDTAEFDKELLKRLNLDYSKSIWKSCCKYAIPLVYASSAATYGMGEMGYDDDHDLLAGLKPLNPYGESKQEFDKWVLEKSFLPSAKSQKLNPPFWYGLKFFNVYGPNEYHKGRMASVIFHAYHQILLTGKVKLFRSHRPQYQDGKQLRDFIYVKDVVDICFWLMNHRTNSGIYNVGTGRARTFLDLANNVFKAMGRQLDIEFIDTPPDIRDKYQYFTEATMDKLRYIGYQKEFFSLEKGIEEYVKEFLIKDKYL